MTTARRLSWTVLAPAAALVLTALCLRGPFAAVGPVLGDVGDELSLSTGALAVVTSLPLVCFGLLSPFAPALAARIGLHRAVLAGLAVLAVGIGLRSAGAIGLFAGTVVLSGGIAIANVLLPAVARAEYGSRSAAVVGAVTGSMALSASLGAGLAQPLTALTGSAMGGLALWLAPVALALVAMGLLARARPESPAPPPAPGRRTAILRDRVGLAVMAYFGFQSLSFYALLTWLAAILEDDAGVTPVTAGVLVAAAALLGAPLSLLVPPLAARRSSQVGWVVAASAPTAAGILGLLVAPDAAPALWAVLYGLGTGASFPLAMTLILVRTRDAAQTGRLSAASQSLGYLLAASGPLAVGLLHELTDGWTASLLLLLVVLAGQLASGVVAARPRLVRADA
ncbi:CP family cyanate transporter-like MFS transporter [Blastococcus colisei]|uniref:CP family cyanate transporter-like MFS transporter n=1 Tax=Blastococcus colisei TaxID=1564162 RepID=A0A543P1Z4_9ACTN|nr:MFS transporter [Blastococcus colisei]TQN38088.1 CP family cyanate transporter-like MFS transporter [Blastococcus colisei]